MDRLRREHGFSMVELLIVALIVAFLAAIALSSLLGQRAKGQDSAATSDANSLVSHMEACYTDHNGDDPCPGPNSGIPSGTGPGEVDATVSGDTYTLVAYSHSGNTFTVERKSDGTTARSCTADGTPHGGCRSGTW